MKTAEGMVEFAAPQVRDTSEPFVSEIREESDGSHTGARGFGGRALCARVIDPGRRGCVYGPKRASAALARGGERDHRRLWAEYEPFIKRDLSEYRIVYLCVDGAERLHADQPREAVFAAWGIGEDGRKVLPHLMAGSKEDMRRCGRFSRTCVCAGLAVPC